MHRLIGRMAIFMVLVFADTAAARTTVPDLTELGIEELMQVSVVSATRQAQRLADTASAVFVITQDDIRRSGATSVPEALRLAPGVHVARIGGSQWAVTIRGFNGRYANKLLVLVDGRSIYTSAFAGVYWEIQDLLLEDIDRIEVIRGPGASLWGANAVNGVINILTRPAASTGNLVSITAGDPEHIVAGVRHSGAWGENLHYRVYGKYLKQSGLLDAKGQDAGDDGYLSSGGFRLDWTPSTRDRFNLYGGVYDGNLKQNLLLPALSWPYTRLERDEASVAGGHVQGRWERSLSDSSRLSLQMYYQNQQRQDAILSFDINVFDLDLQHTFSLNRWNALIWGLGYRYYHDLYRSTVLGHMNQPHLDYELFSAFIQDQITLVPGQLELTLGGRLEHNDFSGWEFQPNARLLWSPHPRHRVWAAVSRAARTPSRADDNLAIDLSVAPPGTANNLLPLPRLSKIEGNPAFSSEKLTAWEVGYRTWPLNQLSLDMTAFYNEYRDLRTLQPRPDLATRLNGALLIPFHFVNGAQAQTYGAEVAANWQILDQWRLQLAYSWLRVKMKDQPGFPDQAPVVRDGSQPRHQISLLSSFDMGGGLELDLWLRYVDALPELVVGSQERVVAVDAYHSLGARIGWYPRQDLELSLTGTGLLRPSRMESIQEAYPVLEQVEPAVYGQLKWSF